MTTDTPRHHPPAALQRLLAAEPDLVDRIFDYVLELIPELASVTDTPAKIDKAKAAVRSEFKGDRAYVRSSAEEARRELARQVLTQFNGRNATELARRLRISRATVYRYLKQVG